MGYFNTLFSIMNRGSKDKRLVNKWKIWREPLLGSHFHSEWKHIFVTAQTVVEITPLHLFWPHFIWPAPLIQVVPVPGLFTLKMQGMLPHQLLSLWKMTFLEITSFLCPDMTFSMTTVFKMQCTTLPTLPTPAIPYPGFLFAALFFPTCFW